MHEQLLIRPLLRHHPRDRGIDRDDPGDGMAFYQDLAGQKKKRGERGTWQQHNSQSVGSRPRGRLKGLILNIYELA